MPGATRRVDHLEPGEPELRDRRGERLVEDELLDEDRGLQQRVHLLRVVGEVLVQVSEEPGAEVRVAEVVDERAFRCRAAEEGEQRVGRHRRNRRLPHSRVVRVDERATGREVGERAESVLQPIATRHRR